MTESDINEINEHDRHTAVWMKLEKLLTKRRQLHMEKNNHSISTDDTEKLRGRIAECDYILNLGKSGPEIESHDPRSDY